MPDQLDATGLSLSSIAELTANLTTAFQAIYGVDINLDQNSPDGQIVGIFAQAARDYRERLLDIYNSFTVAGAYGIQLDQRVALNGIQRKQGTYTFVDIAVTVTEALTLRGLDADVNVASGTGFTISDDAGNQFILAATYAFLAAGTVTLSFRAQKLGQVETIPNTITNQVTVVLGVSAVNNPGASTIIGSDEETDAQLKIRHAQSFFLGATGPADAVLAAVLKVQGVTDAFVAENTSGTPANGVGAHSLWCIVDGGIDQFVAQAIYNKKGPGCGLTGGLTYNVVRPDGSTIPINYDRPITQPLYIKFSLVPVRAGVSFDTPSIKIALAAALVYHLNQNPNIGDVVTAMRAIAPTGYLTALQVSKNNSTWLDDVVPDDFQHKFTLDPTDIAIS